MRGKRIFILPDAQVKPGVPTSHLLAAGNYIVAHKPDVIVCIGDFYDFPSLSVYEQRGSRQHEGRRLYEDLLAGNDAMRLFLSPLKAYNEQCRKSKHKQYKPRLIFTMGNHEYRMQRAIDSNPQHLEGMLSFDLLDLWDWEVYEYMEIVEVEGIKFSHVFVNPRSLKKGPLGGTIDNKLQKLSCSFVMGHQQHLQIGLAYPPGQRQIGIVAGAFYQHEEDYMGKQGNNHWHGCIVLNEAKNGYGDFLVLSLEYLLDEWLEVKNNGKN